MIVTVDGHAVNMEIDQQVEIKATLKDGTVFGVLCGTNKPCMFHHRSIKAVDLNNNTTLRITITGSNWSDS